MPTCAEMRTQYQALSVQKTDAMAELTDLQAEAELANNAVTAKQNEINGYTAQMSALSYQYQGQGCNPPPIG